MVLNKKKNLPSVLPHKRRMKIAFMGEYQRGKSLIINCLFNRYICEIGKGLETTKEISFVGKFGDFDVYDTIGFGGTLLASNDAITKAKDFDCVIFVCKGKQLNSDELKFLQKLSSAKIPHSIVFNVNSDKYDEEDDKEIEEIIRTIAIQAYEIGDNSIPILDQEVLCIKPHFFPNIDNLSKQKKFAPTQVKELASIDASGIDKLQEFLSKSIYLNLSDYLEIIKEIRKFTNGNI